MKTISIRYANIGIPVPPEQVGGEAHDNHSGSQGTHGQSQQSPGKETHHVYDNIVAATNARCMNGDAVTKDATNSSPIHLPKHLYKNIKAEGVSYVLNGNVDGIEFFKVFFSPQQLIKLTVGANEEPSMT